MNVIIKCAIVLVVVLALTVGMVGAAVAAPAGAKEPPVLNRITLVHQAGASARKAAPAKPTASSKALYKYSGIHWDKSRIPVSYQIDSSDNADFNQSFRDGIGAAFETWESDPGSYIVFTCNTAAGSDWDRIPSSFIGSGSRNGVNEVGWAPLGEDAIAMAVIWYGRDKHIVEVDTAMNSDLPWTQNDVGLSDPNTTKGDENYYDVQAIMTHEAGHWLVLDDLYTSAASQQTMYGYGIPGELKARTLESGDIAGLRKIYPGA